LDNLFSKIYEDNASGKLTDDRYMMLSKRYDDESITLKKKIATFQAELDADERHKQTACFRKTPKRKRRNAPPYKFNTRGFTTTGKAKSQN